VENREQATHREMLDYKERYKRSEEKCQELHLELVKMGQKSLVRQDDF